MAPPMAYHQSPISFQRGRGFGGILRSIFRGVIPFFQKPAVKTGIKSLGKAAASALFDAGHRALNEPDVSFSDALKSSSKLQAQSLLNQARSQLGGKRKLPSTRRRAPRTKKRALSSKVKSKKHRRGQSRDIFS